MKTPEYNDLVFQTYIDPIRSVVIIDDKFPTYDHLLNQGDEALQKHIPSSSKTYLNVLCNLCKEHRWTYHIEDNLPTSDAAFAYNADLIFLDFKLDEGDGGEKAIAAIRDYSFLERFNLIVVYTDENTQQAFAKIVESIGKPDVTVDESCKETILNLEMEKSGFSSEIKDIIRNNYYKYILNPKKEKKTILEQINEKLIALGVENGKTAHDCFQWALEQIVNEKFNKNSCPQPIKGYFDDNCNWLQIGRLFLTVIHKDIDLSVNDLFEKIVSATYAWNPTPGQLIMKDVKNQIDDFCFFDLFSSEKQESAWFYFTYISAQKFMLENDILHNLVDLVKDKLVNRLHPKFQSLAKDKEISDFYPSRKSADDNLFHDINFYNSTLNRATVTHFSTGMIFKDKEYDSTYWICMTQECDLEPSQNSFKWAPGDYYKPITFVKLHIQNLTNALSYATRGYYVFVDDEKNKKALCIASDVSDDKVSNPHYETFFAPAKGVISSPQEIDIYQVDCDQSTQKLIFVQRRFSFIAQLRQEYASMLLQKISNHKARIPVNYINKESST